MRYCPMSIEERKRKGPSPTSRSTALALERAGGETRQFVVRTRGAILFLVCLGGLAGCPSIIPLPSTRILRTCMFLRMLHRRKVRFARPRRKEGKRASSGSTDKCDDPGYIVFLFALLLYYSKAVLACLTRFIAKLYAGILSVYLTICRYK